MSWDKPPALTMFNSSPMLITKSVFKKIFVLSNNQTCTFPLIACLSLKKKNITQILLKGEDWSNLHYITIKSVVNSVSNDILANLLRPFANF